MTNRDLDRFLEGTAYSIPHEPDRDWTWYKGGEESVVLHREKKNAWPLAIYVLVALCLLVAWLAYC